MDREERNKWHIKRKDEPGAYLQVGAYVQAKYDLEEWDARHVEFIEEVEDEAKDKYDERSTSGLRDQRNLIGEHVEKQFQQFERTRLHRSGFELIASEIQLMYRDCSGRAFEDLEVVPRGAFVPNPDEQDGAHGPRPPQGSLVLRPRHGRDGYILEPTAWLLEGNDMPTDVQMSYSFDALDISKNDTWEDIKVRLDEQIDFWKELVQKDHQELMRLQARLEVYDVLLERLAKGRNLPWEEATETRAGDFTRDRRQDDSKRMTKWEINAAQLYAYAQEHGQPSSMKEFRNETHVSPRQAWDKLKEQGYGIGAGVSGFVDALEKWAPDFEEKYGKEKARKAARKGFFKWPDEHEA
jgi:hypothetical protein